MVFRQLSPILVRLWSVQVKSNILCSMFTGNLKAPVIPVDLPDLMNDLSIRSDIQSTVYGDITGHFKENHVQLVNEIKCLIKDKIKLVNK